MKKSTFLSYIANKHSCTRIEAAKVVDLFTSSVIGALSQGEDVSLSGFGNFSVSEIKSRPGRNPSTGETLQIKAYKQPKFKVHQKLKDSCNE